VEERRTYRRIQAPVYVRPAGLLAGTGREPVDISLGGVRVFSDDKYRLGQYVKMEFFADGVQPFTYTAEVVWIEKLPKGGPAAFDVGLKFVDLAPGALEALAKILGPEAEGPESEGT
jgi:hypothetical protein